MKNENHIVIWGDGYPLKISASNEKNKLLASLFSNCGYDFSFSNKLYYKNWGSSLHDNVKFFNKRKNTVLNYVIAISKEIRFLKDLKSKYCKVVLLGSYTNIFVYLFYSLVCRLINVKLILNIMEWHIAQNKGGRFIQKINPILFDKYAFSLSDGAIPISSFIETKLKQQSIHKLLLKIPVLADIEKIDSLNLAKYNGIKYCAYCGGIGYLDVIDLILDSFSIFIDKSSIRDFYLYLVISGNPFEIRKLIIKIRQMRNGNKIKVFRNLTFDELIGLYKNAEILLMPLRNTDQDKARYPHKIGEYTICAKPIISNCVGEVCNDFEHKKNIYFADDYSADSFANAINELACNSELRESIAANARLKGMQLFNIKSYIDVAEQFLKNI